ncbi:hypothetical protein BDZ89DRAFT_336652 [Hymenopellis radicata]|nr:hypothetical protein BDZ89DRAFT_336652 [Hymenopellis radicata]
MTITPQNSPLLVTVHRTTTLLASCRFEYVFIYKSILGPLPKAAKHVQIMYPAESRLSERTIFRLSHLPAVSHAHDALSRPAPPTSFGPFHPKTPRPARPPRCLHCPNQFHPSNRRSSSCIHPVKYSPVMLGQQPDATELYVSRYHPFPLTFCAAFTTMGARPSQPIRRVTCSS